MTVEAECRALDHSLRRRGALVLAFFALVWAAAGSSGVTTGASAVAVGACAVLLTGTVVVLALRRGSDEATARQRRLPERWNHRIGMVNGAQAAGIAVTVLLLVNLNAAFLLPAAVCLVVGLHFFPLARLYDQPQYRWTGVLLILVAVAGVAVSATGGDAASARAWVGLGAAVVLWGSSVHVAVRN